MQELFAENPSLNVLTNTGQVARISNETFVSLMNAAAGAVNAIKADALEEAAEVLRNSERLRSFTDDHMGDVNEAADELDRMAAALRSTEKGTGQ